MLQKVQVASIVVPANGMEPDDDMGEIVVTIAGLTPLMQHNAGGMRPSGGMGTKKIPTPEVEAEAGTYRIDDGTGRGPLYVPSNAIRSTVLNGAKGFKVGRTAATAILSGAMIIEPDICPLFTEDGQSIHDYKIDQRRAVVQRNGIVRARPIIFPWCLRFSIMYDTEFVQNPDVFRDIVARAGRTVGLLEYRPEKKGWFGKFKVIGWEPK